MLGRDLPRSVTQKIIASMTFSRSVGSATRLFGLVLLLARTTEAQGRPGTILGTVFDSLARRTLGGAVVQAIRADDPTQTRALTVDSLGLFRMEGLSPGPWVLTFVHPDLETLGIEPLPRRVELPEAGTLTVDLASPSPETVRDLNCTEDPSDASANGMLIGTVREGNGAPPAEGAAVLIWWNELVVEGKKTRFQKREHRAPVQPSGVYALCGVPTDIPLSTRAVLGERVGGSLLLDMPAGAALRQDYVLPVVLGSRTEGESGAPRLLGTASFRGVARRANGEPFADARIVVPDAGATAITDAQGRFVLDSLPSGTWVVEARAIGYEPRRFTVNFPSENVLTRDIALNTAVRELSSVVIKGVTTRWSTVMNDMATRSSRGGGVVLTQANPSLAGAFRLAQAFSAVRGFRMVPVGALGSYEVRGRQNCRPTLFLDGIRVGTEWSLLDDVVPPSSVIAIEAYPSAAGVPGEFLGDPRCGSIVVWTKRGG